MELTSKIKADCRVSASLDGDTGESIVKVFAQADYAEGMSATAELPADDIPMELRARVQDALAAVLAYAEGKLGPRMAKALVKSAEVAAQFKEI